MMSGATKNSLKARINNIYRNYLTLSYYSSQLLKNTLPTEENLKKLEKTKEKIIQETKQFIEKLHVITEKKYEVVDYIEPLKISADLLNSEHFFITQTIIESIIKAYEDIIPKTIEELRISPLDQLKVNRIDFI